MRVRKSKARAPSAKLAVEASSRASAQNALGLPTHLSLPTLRGEPLVTAPTELGGKLHFLDGVYDKEVMASLYIALNHVPLLPSALFISNRLLRAESKCVDELSKRLPPAIAIFITRHLKRLRAQLRVDRNAGGGWEVWSRVSTVKSPSFGYLHVDNDELHRVRTNETLCPVYGSILYVGPRYSNGGGETAFIDPGELGGARLFEHGDKKMFSALPFVLVCPVPGRLVTFDGSIPHAVMWTSGETDSPRVTLLANYWSRRISSVPSGVFMAEVN